MDAKFCLICTAPIQFNRFRIAACRACASFYKRARLAGKRFTCRQGKGQCDFRKHERFMCRACRFDKCVKLGMEMPEESVDGYPFPSPPSDNLHADPLIPKMAEAYMDSYKIRLAHEEEVAERLQLERADCCSSNFYVNTVQSHNELFPVIIREMVEICERVFPFLRSMKEEDKESLFATFIGKFCMLEGFYRTFTFITSKYFMVSLITCVDSHNISGWIDEDDVSIERKADFRAMVTEYAEQYADLLVSIYSIDRFTEKEFHALLILSFCDIDLSNDYPDELVAEVEAIRRRVFHELQEYYKTEEMLTDYSTRMGKLLTISHATNEAGIIMNEEFRTYSALFDVNSGDTLLREILAMK